MDYAMSGISRAEGGDEKCIQIVGRNT